MKSFKNNHLPLFILAVFTILGVLFNPIFRGQFPTPADTIVGLYHPWRDVVWDGYVSGVPYKNFLTTDPVRQQYPWRELSIDKIKNFELPLWNPYTFSGSVLLGNHQSAPFYPLNALFLILPFSIAWTALVVLQPILQIVGMSLYLRNRNISLLVSLLSGLVWAFSGFSVAWMTWNTVVHTIAWLPFVLLSIDKIIYINSKPSYKLQVTSYKYWFKNYLWPGLLVFSLCSSFFAGHLQTFFYGAIFSFVYACLKVWQLNTNKKEILSLFALCFFLFALITSIQWIPTFEFILHSARDIQRSYWTEAGWFFLFYHLIQSVAPDFFGNPTTLNYWGVWNYGEFVGYIGIIPLFFALSALLYKKSKSLIFFGISSCILLIFMLPTPLAKIPYLLNIPLISTSQPTRLLGILDFCLVILASYGIEQFFVRPLHSIRKQLIVPLLILIGVFGLLWGSVVMKFSFVESQYWSIAQKNLLFPTGIFMAFGVFLVLAFSSRLIEKKTVRLSLLLFFCIITMSDLGRFMWKFVPFSNSAWLFPKTQIISYLQSQPGQYRFMSTDSRLFPPNFSTHYKLQTVDGYDPLYLSTYGEFVGAWIRQSPDLSAFNFNRIITPQNYESHFADISNVKYVLSLKDEQSPKLSLIMREGDTRLYENTQVFPRAYLVENVEVYPSKQSLMEAMFTQDLRKTALVYEPVQIDNDPLSSDEYVTIVSYRENTVRIESSTRASRFMVLTDSYYPNWRASVDGTESKIYKTNYAFRGIVVPQGVHTIQFTMNIF